MNPLETVPVVCPYCGEQNDMVIDTSVPRQEYIEDCAVCCRPMIVRVAVTESGEIDVSVNSENG